MRKADIIRKTKETDIALNINLDGSGKGEIDTGCGFLNHMLTLFTAHSMFDINVKCIGDIDVDYHHTTEDIGIALGEAFANAIGDKRGIVRYGNEITPMDEALVLCAVDISGRSYINFDVKIPTQRVGDFDTELIEEFFCGFVRKAEITLHFDMLYGTNSHHIMECCFKAFAHALRKAVSIDKSHVDVLPSTKGVL